MFSNAYAWLMRKATFVWNKVQAGFTAVRGFVAKAVKDYPVFSFLVVLCIVASPFSELASAILFLIAYIAFWIWTWFTIWSMATMWFSGEHLVAAGAPAAAVVEPEVIQTSVKTVVEEPRPTDLIDKSGNSDTVVDTTAEVVGTVAPVVQEQAKPEAGNVTKITGNPSGKGGNNKKK